MHAAWIRGFNTAKIIIPVAAAMPRPRYTSPETATVNPYWTWKTASKVLNSRYITPNMNPTYRDMSNKAGERIRSMAGRTRATSRTCRGVIVHSSLDLSFELPVDLLRCRTLRLRMTLGCVSRIIRKLISCIPPAAMASTQKVQRQPLAEAINPPMAGPKTYLGQKKISLTPLFMFSMLVASRRTYWPKHGAHAKKRHSQRATCRTRDVGNGPSA